MKRFIFIFFLIFITAALCYSQEKSTVKNIKHNAFSGTLMIGAEGGLTLGYTDYSLLRPDLMGRGVLEYFFPTSSNGTIGIKGFASGGYVGGKDLGRTPNIFHTKMTDLGGGLSYTFNIKNAVFPYVFVGASYLWFDPMNADNGKLPNNLHEVYKKHEINYHTAVGLRFLVTDAINLSLNIGGEFSPNDNWDDITTNGNNDVMMTIMAGVGYSLFTKVDSDGDGVPDDIDRCPNTPANVKVDDFGCPLDSDNDGVPDYKDKCPNTKPGMEVNADGCAIDSDGDGVPNSIDKCPNTPAGMKVNEYGCPDSDNDGVFDNADKCPGTPAGAKVDASGCAVDSDGDGVPDYKDNCPNTPKGEQVDKNGCATEKEVVVKKITKKLVLSGDTNFEFNKAALLPAAYPMLNKLAETMKQNPDTRWQIIGNTDAVGSESYNMKLSRERAQSVINYLVEHGIDRDRFELIANGENNPVASNKTPEGRAMNRRVEIKLIEK